MQSHRTTAAALALFAVAGLAQAQQDVFWNNPQGGVWSDAGNWLPGVVPNNNAGNLFSATLDLQDAPYVVNLDIDVMLQNFSLLWGGAVLNLEDRSMTTNEDFRVVGGLITRGTRGGPTGNVEVGGELLLDGATLLGAGTITSNGSVSFAGNATIDICNTGVDHRGAGTMSWDGAGNINIAEGGSLSNGAQSTFAITPGADRQITGDGTGTLSNEGLLINGDFGRGESGTTTLSGVNFFNTGTVSVDAGALFINSSNNLTPDGVLSDGTWNVRNGSALSLGESEIFELGAEVNIAGPNSAFANIASLQRVRSEGRFSISEGQSFAATDFFTNNGEVEVGQGSTFDASEGLGNLDGDALFGGSFIVAGNFLTGASDIRRLEGDLTLVGQDSNFQGIQGLQRVGSSGRFALEDGRTFVTQSDLALEAGGTVRVGSDARLDIAGRLTSNQEGVLGGGRFEVLGTLSASGLNIQQIQTELILEGVGSQVLDETGADALSSLNRIGANGQLRLQDGRSLSVIEDLDVENLLSVEGARAPDRTFGAGLVSVSGNLHFMEGSTLELIINGSVPSLYGQVLAVTTEIDPGATLSLIVTPGSDVGFGDEFFLLQTALLDGAFSNVILSGLGDGLDFELTTTTNGIVARVVPAPGVLGLLAPFGLAGIRRRR